MLYPYILSVFRNLRNINHCKNNAPFGARRQCDI